MTLHWIWYGCPPGQIWRMVPYGTPVHSVGRKWYLPMVPHRTPLLRIRDVLVPGVLPTTALRCNVAVSEIWKNTWERKAVLSLEIASAMVSPTFTAQY